MSSWGCESGHGPACSTTPGATFDHDLPEPLQRRRRQHARVADHLADPDLHDPLPPLVRALQLPVRHRPMVQRADNACYNGFATTLEWSFPARAFRTRSRGPSPTTPRTTAPARSVSPRPATRGRRSGYDALNVGAETATERPSRHRPRPRRRPAQLHWAGAYCDNGQRWDRCAPRRSAPGCWTATEPMAEIVTAPGSSSTVVVKPNDTHGWGILPTGDVAVTTNNAAGKRGRRSGGQPGGLRPGSVEFQTKSGHRRQAAALCPGLGRRHEARRRLVARLLDLHRRLRRRRDPPHEHVERLHRPQRQRRRRRRLAHARLRAVLQRPGELRGAHPPLHTWATWHPMDPGQIWWSTSAIPGTDFTTPFGSYEPLDSIVDAYPTPRSAVSGSRRARAPAEPPGTTSSGTSTASRSA